MKIGLEVHAALPMKSKLFCSCSTSATEPNTAICPICMGLPGSKPMLNKSAIEVGKLIANALYSKVPSSISFIRKVYFYPDLPKSYQITQLDESIGIGGHVDITSKSVRIRRIQIEEDPARIIRNKDYSLLDFNRSGKPLVEIVTEPDIETEDQLKEFLVELRSILYYAGVDINEEIKADLNISMAEQRVEVKNITGTNNLVMAAKYEMARQVRLLSKNEPLRAETRIFDEEAKETISAREKESDEEYGFIYDPDLTAFSTDEIYTAEPIIARGRAGEYAKEYGFDRKLLLELVTFNKQALKLIDATKGTHAPETILHGIELVCKYQKCDIAAEAFSRLLDLVDMHALINADVISKVERGDEVKLPEKFDRAEISKFAEELVASMPKAMEEYKQNKNEKVINFIIGRIIRKFNVDPREAKSIVLEIAGGGRP